MQWIPEGNKANYMFLRLNDHMTCREEMSKSPADSKSQGTTENSVNFKCILLSIQRSKADDRQHMDFKCLNKSTVQSLVYHFSKS